MPQMMGGTQSVVHDLSTMLQDDGHRAAVSARITPSGFLYLKNRGKSKLPFIGPCPSDRILGYPTYRGWNSIECIYSVCSTFRPDIVIMHGGWPLPEVAAVGDLGIPTIVYFHDISYVDSSKKFPHSRLVSCVANSNFTAGRVMEKLGAPCPVVLPITRLSKYALERMPQYVTLINPIEKKGVDIAIAIAEARPDIQFLFVQAWQTLDENADGHIVQKTRKYKNIRFSRSVLDMKRIYRNTKILIMPSLLEESWGRSAVEAQASGIPVVARDTGGLPEAVGCGGILLPSDASPSAWVEAVSLLWDSKTDYDVFSRRASENAAKIEKNISESYHRLVGICLRHIADS